jgi:hypothetical protein
MFFSGIEGLLESHIFWTVSCVTSFANCASDRQAIRAGCLFIGDILNSDESGARRIGAVGTIWCVELDLFLLVSLNEVTGQEHADTTASCD